MTTELEAAIERVKRVLTEGYSTVDAYRTDATAYRVNGPEHLQAICDSLFRSDLALIAIAHIEAEAERKRERAEPVTPERLKADGFVFESPLWVCGRCSVYLSIDDRATFHLGNSFATEVKTMGQVLDLLAALREEA